MGLPDYNGFGAASSSLSAWERKIPETVLDLYLNSLRNYPAWKRICPSYVHPAVKESIELAYNSTLVRIGQSEYVFTFSERTTSLDELGEDVTTGQLEVRYTNTLVFRVGASFSPGEKQRSQWTPRTVELFVDGAWVQELSKLSAELRQHELQQMSVEKQERDKHTDELLEIRRKLGTQPPGMKTSASPPAASQRAQTTPKERNRPWWRAWGSKKRAG